MQKAIPKACKFLRLAHPLPNPAGTPAKNIKNNNIHNIIIIKIIIIITTILIITMTIINNNNKITRIVADSTLKKETSTNQ